MTELAANIAIGVTIVFVYFTPTWIYLARKGRPGYSGSQYQPRHFALENLFSGLLIFGWFRLMIETVGWPRRMAKRLRASRKRFEDSMSSGATWSD